jgi:hypothetical protein
MDEGTCIMRNFVTFTPLKYYSGDKIKSSERDELRGIYRDKCIGIKCGEN